MEANRLSEGNFVIFKNDHKREENHPDFRGKIMLNGIERDMALWIKQGNGQKYFGGKVDGWNKTTVAIDEMLEPVPIVKEEPISNENIISDLNPNPNDLPF